MKKLIENLVGVVVLVVVAYYVVTGVFNINIKNPFAGKSELPESMVEDLVAEAAEALGYNENEYTWKVKHSHNRDRHQDTVEVTLFCSNENGSLTYNRIQTYQYYKENDVWEKRGDWDGEIKDKRYNLKELIDGKTFSETDESGDSYTVTLSNLDMAAQTVTATYRYRYTSKVRRQGETYFEYYIKNLDGNRVDELSGTIECNIDGNENIGYSIKKVVGNQCVGWKKDAGWDGCTYLSEIAIRLRFDDPLRFDGVWMD